MPEELMHLLAAKWLAGMATEQEIALLQEWYRNKEEQPSLQPDPEMEARLHSSIHATISRHRSRRKMWAAAAVLVLLAGTGVLYQHRQQKELAVYVPRNTYSRLVLPDGSVVTLNADSHLQYHDREVLLDGEAFFTIKADPKRPFVVKAGNSITTVLGTTFNIRAYKDDPQIRITVNTGKVQVQDGTKHKIILTANKQIMLTHAAKLKEKNVNAALSNAWIDGSFEIDNETFEEVTNRLSRKYNVTFHFEQPELRHCTFLASFDKAADLTLILSLLCKINNSTFRMSEDNKEVYITGAGCNPAA